VAQASSWLQQLLNWIENLLRILVKSRVFKQLYSHRFRGPGGWLVTLAVVVAMLFGNWQLLLTTSTGVFVMVLVYSIQQWDWQLYWSRWHRFFSGSNRQLTLAVGSGGIATLSTYMAVAIWIDSDSSWIAAGAIVQGFGTIAILVILVWQIVSRQGSRDERKCDQMLSDLSDADPVKRLLAVRQLTRWGTNHRLPPSMQHLIADCFRLMLSREAESVIREAVLDGLQVLDNQQMLGKGAVPLQTPIALKRSITKVHH